MKSRKLTTILMALILMVTAVGVSAKNEAKTSKPISNTRTASCLVKITAEPDFLLLDFDTVDYLLHSSGIYGKAAREVLGIPVDNEVDLFHISISSTSSVQVSDRSSRSWTGQELKLPVPALPMMPGSVPHKPELKLPVPALPMMPSSVSQKPEKSLTSQGFQTILFELGIKLPEEIKPAAEEFMIALTDNLRTTLEETFHDNYKAELEKQLSLAEDQRDKVLSYLSDVMALSPADIAIEEKLNEMVDLSELRPDMPLNEAIEILKNSVDPPLNVFVNWGDLFDNADIEETTPININPISTVKLSTALKYLLEAVSGGFAELGFAVEDGLIVIATVESLPQSKQELLLQTAQVDKLLEINQEAKQNILLHKHNLEMEIAGKQARQSAIEQQIERIKKEVSYKIATDPITEELNKIVKIQLSSLEKIKKLVENGRSDNTELEEQEEKLARAKIELAQRRQSIGTVAGGDGLAKFNDELTDIMIDLAENKAHLRVIGEQIEQQQEQIALAATFDPQISQIRAARKAFATAENRFNELKVRIANLQPPIVTVFGGQ